jgi:sugar-specific transcriptional regulator TrmB
MRAMLKAVLLFSAIMLASYLCEKAWRSYPREEVACSPGDAISLVLKVVNRAEKFVHVAGSSRTIRYLEWALSAAHKRGIDVRVVADKEDYLASTVRFLNISGVPVRLGFTAHKAFVVVDARHVQIGEFGATDFDAKVDKVVVTWNDPRTADSYAAEWERLWKEGEVRDYLN